MRIDAVVINASPLITLFRSDQADLLPRLFTHIVVPEAVWQEVVLDEWEEWADRAARELSTQSWPVRAEVTSSPRVAAWEFGAGEAAVLSHALANPPLRAMIDDMDANWGTTCTPPSSIGSRRKTVGKQTDDLYGELQTVEGPRCKTAEESG